nr:EOG090X01W2 [Polyphemus pediculus]
MEQFDQLLTCAICLDRYRNPKLLPCQHSFCMEPCMEGLVNYVTRQVKCPECRAEHRIPYQGIQQYPTNVTLQRFLELHIEITGELPDPTSGQVMERCGVCSEKSYCGPCSHCDKKVCADCKEAHLDILRREISRVNNQVRRTLPRLQDALGVIEKNSTHLQQNCASIIEEVDDIYHRLSKALKERTDFIKGEIEIFLAKEVRTLTSLRENLTHEISNFDSNSEFAEKHIGEGSVWDDNELMDAKDIFLRTMEFIRNFESEPGEYHRRVRFFVPQDLNQMAATLSNLGELTINPTTPGGGAPQAPTPPSLGPGLMRSKSDHRVAAQFRQAEERYLSYGSENTNEEVGNRRYFGDRLTVTNRYGDPARNRGSDYDFESDLPSSGDSGRRSRFRSRFMRHHDSGDSDNEPSSRSVRFHDTPEISGHGHGPSAPVKKERERVLDTEDATRGPLSGITRLVDSPRVIKRIQEMELKGKKKDKPAPPALLNLQPAAPQPTPTSQTTGRRANRQVSEEDEIAKIKKQNKQEQATASSDTAAATAQSRKSSASDPTTPTSSGSRFTTPTTPTVPEKKEEPTPSAAESEEARRKRNPYLRSQSTPGGEDASKTETASTRSSTGRPSYSRTSSNSSLTQDEGTGRNSRVGRISVDRFSGKRSSNASTDSSTSAESSTHSSPVRNTGAAFSTEELKNRFSRKTTSPTADSSAASAATPTTTRSRFGTVSSSPTSSVSAPSNRFGSSSSSSSSSTPTAATSTASAAGVASAVPRFQSRFLGRAGTPTAEASKGSENSQSSSSESSSESESADSDRQNKTTSVKQPTSEVAAPNKDRELARTDIGPLLARSAQARDSTTSYSSGRHGEASKPPDTAPPFMRSRGSTASASSVTSPTSGRPPTAGSSADASGSSRFRPGADYSNPRTTSIARSRTGSSLHTEDMENKYPLTSKYLNRSRANMADSSSPSDSSSYSPRYGRYQSRFLNKSKSSAALASERDEDDDGADVDSAGEGNHESDLVDGRADSSDPSQLASGEERYPSGRSRYAALKDRRSRLARSKSSHEVPADSENSGGNGGEVGDTGTSSTQDQADPESGSGSSLSTWARYLKNKYGPRNKEGDNPEADAGGNKQQRFTRSRSGSTANGAYSDADNKEDRESNQTLSPSSGLANMSRHQYMQKRRVQMKFGTRGSEQGSFTWPRGVAVGPDNSIVVADSSNHRVQVFDAKGRFLKEFGLYGNGEGEFDCLAGVAINRIGQFIIADRYNHRIQVFDPSGRFLRVFGAQGSTDGKFSYPWGVTTDALGFIYVCDKENHRVQVFQSDGTFVGKFGSLGNRPGQLEHPHYIAVQMKFGTRGSEQGSFTWPRGVAVGPDNSIVVADSSNHRVQVFDAKGRFLKEFGLYGNGEGEFDCLAGVAINRIGQFIIADRYNHRIQVFDPSGRFLRVFGAQGSTDGKFSYPWGVTTDALGFIYVCDKENHRVQVFQSDGTFVGKFGSLGNRPGQLEHPHYIAVSSTNRVIVSDSNNHRIQVFDVNGKVITTFGGEGADEGSFKFPRGVAVDDQGYIIVADSGNNRIQIFNPEGVFMKAFGCWGSGDGEFKGLEGIAVLSNGNIVVCDRENHRIQVF